MHLPDYDDLPPAPNGGRSGWGIFGADDELGLVNLLTPARVAAAASLITRGVSFSLDLPLGSFDPPLNPLRGHPKHTVIRQAAIGFDDSYDNIYPQAGSQWDSLAHIGYSREQYYNGATDDQVASGERNGIHNWSRHGIAGRGVLLDLEQVALNRGDYDPGTTTTFGAADLEEARQIAGVEFEPGDILVLHTGFTHWYTQQGQATRDGLPANLRVPGLEHTEDICRYLWNTHAAAVAADNTAVEAWPANTGVDGQPFSFIHQMLIGSFGMALGELWWLHDLAMDCRATGSYVGMLVAQPHNVPGGISSPANATFLK